MQHLLQAVHRLRHLIDSHGQKPHVDQGHEAIDICSGNGVEALFQRREELLHRCKGVAHTAIDLVHAGFEPGSELAHRGRQILRHVGQALLEFFHRWHRKPDKVGDGLPKASQLSEQRTHDHAKPAQDPYSAAGHALHQHAQHPEDPLADGIQIAQHTGGVFALFDELSDVLGNLRIFHHPAKVAQRAQQFAERCLHTAQLFLQGAASGHCLHYSLKELPEPGAYVQQHLAHRLQRVQCQPKGLFCHGSHFRKGRCEHLQHAENAFEGLLDLRCRLVADDELLGHQVEPLRKAVDAVAVCGRKQLMEGLRDGLHYLPNGVHDIPQALHQVLSSGYLAHALGVIDQVDRPVPHFLVQLGQCIVVLLDGFFVEVPCIQLLVTQCKIIAQGHKGGIQSILKQLRVHAAFFQRLCKAARFLDGFFRHRTAGKGYLLQYGVIDLCLVAQLAVQLLPPAVQPLRKPLVQCVDGRHKDVIQPVCQLGPCVGGLFLVAEDQLEALHPLGAYRVLRGVDGFGKALRLLGRQCASFRQLAILPAQLFQRFRAGHAGVFLGHLIGCFHHGGVLFEGLFHDLRVGPFLRKAGFEAADGHLALFQGAQLHGRVDQLLFQGFRCRAHQVQALPVLKLQVPRTVTLGQIPDGALERKAAFTCVCRCVRNTHDHGDHLLDVAARCRHLRKCAGHLVKAETGLVRIPHQLVQVTVDRVDAVAGSIHDGLDVAGLLHILVPAAHQLIEGQALHHFFARIHKLVGDVHQGGGGHDVQGRELGLQCVQTPLHRGKIHIFGGSVQLFKALFRSLELELFHQLVDGADGLFCVFLKVFVVELHFNNAAVYFSAHSVLTSPHARAAIRSKMGRMAGLM